MSQGSEKGIDYEKFAQYTVERWQERIVRMKAVDTGELYRSFVWHVYRDAGGDVERMVYTFKLYGWYVELGTGNGYYHGNPGDLEFLKDWKTNPNHRKRRPWYSPQMWHEMKRLAELSGRAWGEKAMEVMKREFAGTEWRAGE